MTTIHPFADGNGRVGRSLIGAILARRQVCQDVIPPISLVLSRDRDGYIDTLTTWRFELDGHRQGRTDLVPRPVERGATDLRAAPRDRRPTA